MTRLCLMVRENKRKMLFLKYKNKRLKLRKIINSLLTSLKEKEIAQLKMQKLPKDSNRCRLRNRCWRTGRGNGVYRRVGLSKSMFRYYVMRGDVPGIKKSSW